MQILLSRGAQLDNGTVLLAGVYNVVSLSVFPSQWPPKLSALVSQDLIFHTMGNTIYWHTANTCRPFHSSTNSITLELTEQRLPFLSFQNRSPWIPRQWKLRWQKFMSSVSKAIQGKTSSNSHFSLQWQKNWAYFCQWPIMLHKFAWRDFYMCKMHMRRREYQPKT